MKKRTNSKAKRIFVDDGDTKQKRQLADIKREKSGDWILNFAEGNRYRFQPLGDVDGNLKVEDIALISQGYDHKTKVPTGRYSLMLERGTKITATSSVTKQVSKRFGGSIWGFLVPIVDTPKTADESKTSPTEREKEIARSQIDNAKTIKEAGDHLLRYFGNMKPDVLSAGLMHYKKRPSGKLATWEEIRSKLGVKSTSTVKKKIDAFYEITRLPRPDRLGNGMGRKLSYNDSVNTGAAREFEREKARIRDS